MALLIADDWQGCGLGTRLLNQLLTDAVSAGLREARLETLHGNLAMQALARRTGFDLKRHPEDALLVMGSRALGSQTAHAIAGAPPVA
jgi:ribosomal protein S18 acetylase RimI-like enzyme